MTALPTLFLSHGAPTYALQPGDAGAQLAALGARLPRPRALLVVSPHWMTRGLAITAAAQPGTLHDFGGFPAPLYALQYPAPGQPALAAAIAAQLTAADWPVALDEQRPRDHGVWVPLLHLLPAADVPVLQLSMPQGLGPDAAWALGQALRPWSDEGVLVIGSGSLTHNLYELGPPDAPAAAHAQAFVEWVRAAVLAGDDDALVHTLQRAPQAARAHPTIEHFLPLLVAAGAARPGAPAAVLPGGMRHGVLSMESYVFGALAGGQPCDAPAALAQ
ncbi:MAG: dioxygenase [Burkholderiales bacterium]|nr:dioxygenase [Burkholderiales bacterium]